MQLIINGTAEEVQKVLQAIAGGKEHKQVTLRLGDFNEWREKQ